MYYESPQAALRAAQTQSLRVRWIDFDGRTCEDSSRTEKCRGWNGKDARCACGTHRIGWAAATLGPLRWVVYATAL